jgi:two-component system sensor histidine kinase YesM
VEFALRGINELSGSVQSLIDNRIKIENEKREYEYRMLQSQINPHFLYNTLNSIKWMASIQHATGIPEMTTALSRLLKSIAKDSRQRVPIETELSFLDDYYTIQKYRYGGGITMEVELEEQSLAANEILRFTLQPIVENAIFHGIEPKGGVGTIKIHIARQGSDVCIDVTDNGVGMDADTLAGLLDGEEQNRSNFFRDIGISNVHRRLRYEYGEAYGLSFTSEPGVYTTVRVMLPGKIYTDTENS